jgi:hypothetical protein
MVLNPFNGWKTKPVGQGVKPSKQLYRPLTKRHPLKERITQGDFLSVFEFTANTSILDERRTPIFSEA